MHYVQFSQNTAHSFADQMVQFAFYGNEGRDLIQLFLFHSNIRRFTRQSESSSDVFTGQTFKHYWKWRISSTPEKSNQALVSRWPMFIQTCEIRRFNSLSTHYLFADYSPTFLHKGSIHMMGVYIWPCSTRFSSLVHIETLLIRKLHTRLHTIMFELPYNHRKQTCRPVILTCSGNVATCLESLKFITCYHMLTNTVLIAHVYTAHTVSFCIPLILVWPVAKHQMINCFRTIPSLG